MASSTPAERVVVVAGNSPDVRLTVWPLRDAPLVAWSVIVAATLVSLAAAIVAASWTFGLVALASFIAALWRFWTPVEIRLYELGVAQTAFRRSWRMPWRAVAAYRICNGGVLLLPDEDDSPLGRLKGLYIPWHNRRDEVIAAVEHYLPDS